MIRPPAGICSPIVPVGRFRAGVIIRRVPHHWRSAVSADVRTTIGQSPGTPVFSGRELWNPALRLARLPLRDFGGSSHCGEPLPDFESLSITLSRVSPVISMIGANCRQAAPGRSSAWLERLLWEQEVACSNHVAPTKKNAGETEFGSPAFFRFHTQRTPSVRFRGPDLIRSAGTDTLFRCSGTTTSRGKVVRLALVAAVALTVLCQYRSISACGDITSCFDAGGLEIRLPRCFRKCPKVQVR